MSLAYFWKQTAINQALGVRAVRGLVDTLGSRPRLAPSRRDDDIWGDPFHPELPLRKLNRIRKVLGDDTLWRGKVVVEIGCGMSLGMGIVALAMGARRAIMADREQYLLPGRQSADSHRGLLELVPKWLPQADARYRTSVRFDGDRVVTDGDALTYLLAPGEALPLRDGSVDVLYSHSTLEHVVDLDGVMAELARVTAPGGRNVHHVDLGDHLAPAHPLRMLEYSPRAWRLIASNRRGWTNRLRLPDHLRCYERHGFRVEALEITRALSAAELAVTRPRLHRDYRAMPDEDLARLGFICVLRRP